MGDRLWPLLRLSAPTELELLEKYRQVYLSTYVCDEQGRELVLHDWKGNRVRFHAGAFEHAFSESSQYRLSSGVHDKLFSKRRARHILWIKEVLGGTKGTIERRQQIRKDSRGRLKKRRTFLVVEEKYVVVLSEDSPKNEWQFVTAFPADLGYFEKIRRESSLLEIKKPQS